LADSPALIILVSNSLPEFGSSGPFPFVTVWGTESLFSTWITLPFLTLTGFGLYAGFPCIEAPCWISRVAPIGPLTLVAETPLVVFPPAAGVPSDDTDFAYFACPAVELGELGGSTNNLARIL
jgi:hypothetical protein